MNYVALQALFGQQNLFSSQEIKRIEPTFDPRRLVEWQAKGYIRRIVNGWYRFAQTPLGEPDLWAMANRIYAPSYLSLHTALAYHGLIPEGVYTLTSVSSRKTRTLHTDAGTFVYRHLKPGLFFGYDVVRGADRQGVSSFPVRMADPEKTLLDYCYLTPTARTEADFAALRLNVVQLRDRLDLNRLQTYQRLFAGHRLDERVAVLLRYLDHHA